MTAALASESAGALALAEARAGADPPSALAALLAESHPVYQGLGTSQAEALRGCVLAELAIAGLPAGAVGAVLSDLETSRSASVLAGAALALSGARPRPAEGLALLARAARRLRRFDAPVAFAAEASPATALAHVLRALAAYGVEARPTLLELQAEGGLSAAAARELDRALRDSASAPPARCCGAEAGPPAPAALRPTAELRDLRFEDQAGRRETFASLFDGRASVIAFFYTRCMNPERCSLTITKLAQVAARLAAEGVPHRLAAVTYDPDHDGPAELRAYGAARGFPFGPDARLLRTLGPFAPLRDHFDLGVGYGPSTVNQHRLDLVVLDPAGQVRLAHRHRLWEVAAICDAVRQARAIGGAAAS